MAKILNIAEFKKGKGLTEHEIQASFISWCFSGDTLERYPELDLIYAIPNGSNKSIATAMKFKREGLRSGVPDLCLPVARGEYHSLYMEFKRTAKLKLSASQINWQIKLEKQGHRVTMVSSRDQAIEVVTAYLKLIKGE